MDFRVSTPLFDGPLDLLLHLIRRRELDVCDLALAEITDAYLRHVALLREAAGAAGGYDLEEVGRFLVVAAALVEAKSAGLLPRPGRAELPAAEGDGSPRADLVRQLLDYQRLKRAAGDLEARRAAFARRFPRVPAFRDRDDAGPPPLALEELHAWDLLSIFERLMAEVGRRGPAEHEVVGDDVPIALAAADVLDRLARAGGRVTLKRLLVGRRSRGELIALFLAVLELLRDRRLALVAGGDDHDAELTHGPEEATGGVEPDPAADPDGGRQLRPGEAGGEPDLRKRPDRGG